MAARKKTKKTAAKKSAARKSPARKTSRPVVPKAPKRSGLNKIIVLIAVVLVVLLGINYMNKQQQPQPQPQTTQEAQTTTPNIQAMFTCDGGKTIDATFINDENPGGVALKLSDGRTMTLPHAISADGARYANADESLVFWNVGDGAFLEENGQETYKNCVTSSQ